MQQLTSVAELADLVAAAVARRGSRSGRCVVGLAGPPGVGKSTTAEELRRLLAARGVTAALLPMDGYHRTNAELRAAGSRDRKGAPDTFDPAAFVRALAEARGEARSEQEFAGFDRSLDEPVNGAVRVPAGAQVLITEGNYLLLDEGEWSAVRPLLDISVALTLDDNVRRERLVARHVEFGMTPEAAVAWAWGPDELNTSTIAAGTAGADYSLSLT